ncbi:MAG: FAD-dependent oxidoreductase, partial [Cyclobacteriaceae bacterium]|nr:FAD-dependent oxidoreductase [Cyclobacteriaceae bacterium]
MRVGIIGGGIIGLSSAYYLSKAGHQVTIIEQSEMKDGCSFGNAGMIVPSHLIPLAAPGMISKGIRWMFNSSSPFYVKPRLSGDLIKWGYHFYKSATKEHVARSAPALKEISLLSKSMFKLLSTELPFNFGYHERGLLMLYQTKETEHEEMETAALANAHGIEAHIISAEEVQKLEPDVQVRVKGGVYFPGDAHVTPQLFVNQLKTYLKEKGVVVKDNTEVIDFVIESGKIDSVKTANEELTFDEVVLATGSWSALVAAKLNLSLPMQAGKGYSFTLENVKKNTRIPSIFLEARVAVTPMGDTLRFGGTMEITGIDHSISINRVKGIVDSIPHYYPEMKVEMPKKEEVWHGLRPCSPDGLPYIGRSKKIKNLVIATGHSMMGLSLGPGTGLLVKEIVGQEKTTMMIDTFNPGRFD